MPKNPLIVSDPDTEDVSSVFDIEESSQFVTPCVAHDVASFIDRSFQEALPYQYLREFLVNAIEANATQVIVEPDWVYVENCVENGRDPVYRWSMWDDGHGMDEQRLLRFRQVFDSSKGNMRGRHDNFGMGAKIAGMPCNPYGLIIMSWQNGVGNMIILRKDLLTKQYGLYRQAVEDEDGSIVRLEVAPTPEKYDNYYDAVDGMPVPRVNGTLIIFMGNAEDEHTFLGPTKFDWHRSTKTNVFRFNERFALLNHSKLKVHTYGTARSDVKDWPRSRADACGTMPEGGRYGQYRLVQGATVYWNEACSASGTVNISDGKIHWWLFDHIDPNDLRKKDAYRIQQGLPKLRGVLPLHPKTGLYDAMLRMQDRHSYTLTANELAVLYKNEFYEHIPKARQHQIFNYFGIFDVEVRRRMIIVVEPNFSDDGGIWPNAVRSRLECTERRLPWDRWGMEFTLQFPEKIKSALGDPAFRNNSDLRDRIYANVANIGNRFGLFTGKRPHGHPPGHPSGPPKFKHNPNKGPRRRKAAVGQRGKAMPVVDIIPRESDPRPERPALYNPASRKLCIFEAFHIFQESTAEWLNHYSHLSNVENEIRERVIEVYSSMLLARIIHILSLKGKDEYDASHIEAMLTQEALTVAVTGFLDAHAAIKQKLAGKLGRRTPSTSP